MISQIASSEIGDDFLSGFERQQEVTRVWRQRDLHWELESVSFIERWSESDLVATSQALRATATSGVVFAHRRAGVVAGFAALEAEPIGPRGEYLQLSQLHVSSTTRRTGLGSALLGEVAMTARARGASKLYVSAHSAVETCAFYFANGFTDALWQSPLAVAAEPFDRQLELVL